MTKRKESAKPLDMTSHALSERIKELNCLYSIASIAARHNVTIDEIYQVVADMLPSSWQYPEITCARINFRDKEFKTKNFETSEWKQSASINVEGRNEGTLEVYYLEARPEIYEGPFLKEERLLINSVAELMGEITEHKLAEEEIRNLSTYPTESPNPVLRATKDGAIIYANKASLPLLNKWACQIGQLMPDNLRQQINDVLNSGSKAEIEVECKNRTFSITFTPVQNLNAVNLYGLDITERKRLLDKMQFYISGITKAQEEERKRIARELHDEMAQSMGRLGFEIDSLLRNEEQLSDEMERRFKDMRSLVGRAMHDLHRICHDLRSPILDELGLIEALRFQMDSLNAQTNINLFFQVQGTPRRLSPEVELTFFRITQEALNNLRIHSGATKAKVTLKFSLEKVKLSIIDNGEGFELPDEIGEYVYKEKLGLIGMQERARLINGKLMVRSELRNGSSITLELKNEK